MAELLNGKIAAAKIEDQIRLIILNQNEKPGLAVIQVGGDDASDMYIKMKEKACFRTGICFQLLKLPCTSDTSELVRVIHMLNNDVKIDGILVQLPLPGHIDVKKVSEAISPAKDVDGFNSYNIGSLFLGYPGFIPCTPLGCITLLEHYGISLAGKKAIVIGRSNIVGKPLALLFLQKNATIGICHSQTQNLRDELQNADIVAAAIGKPNFIKGDYLKKGAVVIDFGQHRVDPDTIVGDVDFQSASKKAAWITPVPGGTGPMTVAMLLGNTLKSYSQRVGTLFDLRRLG